LCGFGLDEIELELSRVEKVFKGLGITAVDIAQAKERLVKYYDMELEGVRKMLRLYIKGIVNLVLAKEEGKTKIIYIFMAPGIDMIGSALMKKSKEVYVSYPTQLFMIVFGFLFGKLVPIIEAAEKKWLKAGAVAHCANVKTLVGLSALDILPRPDLLVTSGLLCETAPKTIDLLHELYNIPTYCCDSCKDIGSMEDPNASRTVDLLLRNIKKLSKRMQEIAGFEITNDMLWEAIDARQSFTSVMLKIYRLIESSDPLPIKSTNPVLMHRLNISSYALDDLPDQTDALNTLYEELQERVNKGFAAVEKGAPRIFCVLPAHESDPRLEQLLDDMGIATAGVEGRLFAPDGGYTLSAERPKDPYEILGQVLHNTMYETPKARIPSLIAACKRLNIVGVLDRYHAGCRSVAGDALVIKNAITKELGIPVLVLDWENFDPRIYNHLQYKKRLEVFKTMILSRRRYSA
jgi:benzoyl-CoA reductase/2-hydroxyglutaryl-CoA dehydratase subunit BcrC/BadD/HgdB